MKLPQPKTLKLECSIRKAEKTKEEMNEKLQIHIIYKSEN